MKKLPLKFYRRDTVKVARELLGKKLYHLINGELTGGIICETEAYLGATDRAAHSFAGRRTPRVESMYLPGGYSYVYFIYGLHFCVNVVTKNKNEPEAVLIRALMPTDGIEIMRARRKIQALEQLCSGPGKLCQAMGIERAQNGMKFNGDELWISDFKSFNKKQIHASPRVGIPNAGDAKNWPLRFTVDLSDEAR